MSESFNSCKGCDWAIEASGVHDGIDFHTQTGCHANRLNTFKARGEASFNPEEDYYDLSRTCTLKRENFEGGLEEAIRQIEPLFGIVIEDDGECDWVDVCAAADQIVVQDYNPSKISVILSTNMDRGMKNIVLLTEKIKARGFKHFKSVIHASDADLQVRELDQWRPVASATYFVKVVPKANQRQCFIPSDFLSGIRDTIVDDLQKVILVDFRDDVTVALADMVKGLYMNFASYDLTISKIRELKGMME